MHPLITLNPLAKQPFLHLYFKKQLKETQETKIALFRCQMMCLYSLIFAVDHSACLLPIGCVSKMLKTQSALPH